MEHPSIKKLQLCIIASAILSLVTCMGFLYENEYITWHPFRLINLDATFFNLNNSNQSQKMVKISELTSNSLKILIWTTNTEKIRSFYTIGSFIASNDCPAKCDVTENKTLADQVDAIAVHANQEKGSDMYLPVQRKFNQIRVFFRQEPPRNFKIRHLPNEYNWTMTYRRDSDCPIFYYNFRQKPNVTVSASEALDLAYHSTKISQEKLTELKSRYLPPEKTKLVAWTVSHCKTSSQRERLASQLQKHVPIDVYGQCGKFKCSKKRYDNNWSSYYPELGKSYKFYLSFENALCIDYVTEKFFEALEHDMVPIVYGGANYGVAAPPGSFIDAMTFSSVKELADYIKFLDERPEEYLKYFLWKDKYELYWLNWWCSLCMKLWEYSVVDEEGHRVIEPAYHKVYPDIASWFLRLPGNGSQPFSCREPPTSLLI